MNQNVDSMWDIHLENETAKHNSESHPVTKCYECDCDLYGGDDCYYIEGVYYCEDCIKDKLVTLDFED